MYPQNVKVKLDDLLSRRIEVEKKACKSLDELVSKCESPCEQLLLIELIQSFNCVATFRGDKLRGTIAHPDYDDLFVFITLQSEIIHKDRKYRADFLITIEHIDSFISGINKDITVLEKLVIEVDGHDFHEKTKEQAAKDKLRDRTMAMKGYKIFRYTGSEVFRDAVGVATEIHDYLCNYLEQNVGPVVRIIKPK